MDGQTSVSHGKRHPHTEYIKLHMGEQMEQSFKQIINILAFTQYIKLQVDEEK